MRLRPALCRVAAIALVLLTSTCWQFFIFLQQREAERLVAAWDRQRSSLARRPPPPALPTSPPDRALSLCPAVRQRSPFAIVALLISTPDPVQHQRYHESAVKLGRSILHYSPDALLYADMLLLFTAGAHAVDKFALHRAGWGLCMVDAIASPPTDHANRFLQVGMFTRLQVWRLVEYQAILSVDLDTLVVADLSPIFLHHAPAMLAQKLRLAAVPDSLSPGSMPYCGTQDHFNAGVLLLTPSLDDHDALLAAMYTVEYNINWAEQGLLNALFPSGSYLVLPFRYNARLAEAGCSPVSWRGDLREAVVLHFTVVKGWAMRAWDTAWLGALVWGVVDACLAWEMIGREYRRAWVDPGVHVALPFQASSVTCKHVRQQPTTLVTALWDINRAAHGDGRPFGSYLQWFERTLQINAPFLVFASAKTLARVRRARDATGYPTCYVPLELHTTPYHRLFHDKVEALLASPSYRWKNRHPFRVEAINAEYNILQWSKIYLLSLAQAQLNRFQSHSFMWVDAGLSRFIPPGMDAPFPHPRVVEKLLHRHADSTLFLSGGVHEYADQAKAEARCHRDMPWTGDNLLQGTLMLANGSSIARFETMWRSFLEELLDGHKANNEQVLLAMLWCTDPSWFSVIDVPGATETGHDFLRLDDFFWGRVHGTVARYGGVANLVRRRHALMAVGDIGDGKNASTTDANFSHETISLVVPVIASDLPGDLHRLLQSVARQQVPPMEVILVISGVTDLQCARVKWDAWETLEIHSRVLCFQHVLHQSVSRNLGINTSHGQWVAFVDADDEIFPQYFQVIQEHIAANPRLVLVLHGHTHQRKLHFKARRLFDGHELYQAHVQTRAVHPWILAEIAHGHAVVRTAMAKRVYFSADPQDATKEDSIFVRQVIDLVGDDEDAMLFDNAPLAWYVRRADKTRLGRAWKTVANTATGQALPDFSGGDLELTMEASKRGDSERAMLTRAAEPWISVATV